MTTASIFPAKMTLVHKRALVSTEKISHSCLLVLEFKGLWWVSTAVADPCEGQPPPLFLYHTETRRTEKHFLETGPPPFLRVWMIAHPLPPLPPPSPHLISRSGSRHCTVPFKWKANAFSLFTSIHQFHVITWEHPNTTLPRCKVPAHGLHIHAWITRPLNKGNARCAMAPVLAWVLTLTALKRKGHSS